MALNVSLTPQLEEYIRLKVESGMFASASEVVRAGLRHMREIEEETETLRAAIQGGAESEPGRPADEVFGELEEKFAAAARLRATPPDANAVIEILRANETQLRKRGVAHIALFGSVARGEARAGSDIDLLVDLDPDAPIGVFEYAGIAQCLEQLFPARIDLANRASLKPYVRPSAEAEALHAF